MAEAGISFWAIFLCMFFSIAAPAPAGAGPVTAMPAHGMVNAVGVATHFDWGPNVYATRFDELRTALGDLGVRHIRQSPGNASGAARLRTLHDTLGVKVTAVIDARVGTGSAERLDPAGIATLLGNLKAQLNIDMVAALEGPNEWNLTERLYGRTTWAQELRSYQAELHRQAKADPQLAGKPLLAPSLADPMAAGQYAKLGNIEAWTDRGNAHVYPNWLPFEQKFNAVLDYARVSVPSQKFWVTETGWHTAYNSGGQYVDEATKMKYLGRAMATYASHPDLQRAFYYQLVDDENNPSLTQNNKHMGLIAHDLTRKLGFYAIRNTMAVMCDDPLTFTPQSLNYALSGDLADVRSLLFQKNNRAFYLIVWIERRGFYKGAPEFVPPRKVTLQLDRAFPTMRRYRPTDPSGNPQWAFRPKVTQTGRAEFAFDVQDNIAILELVPPGVATPPVNSGRCSFRPS